MGVRGAGRQALGEILGDGEEDACQYANAVLIWMLKPLMENK